MLIWNLEWPISILDNSFGIFRKVQLIRYRDDLQMLIWNLVWHLAVIEKSFERHYYSWNPKPISLI